MQKYLPHTTAEIKAMLASIGVTDIEALFADIPENLKVKAELPIGKAQSELELTQTFNKLGALNAQHLCFLGGGAYDHYVPSVIKALTSREEFLTAYTPYQPEISQGTLQYIFEYQSMICELTGLAVSNASLYDGTTSAAEAMFMAEAITRKTVIAISAALNPSIKAVLQTYAKFRHLTIKEIPLEKGRTSLAEFNKINDGSLAALIIATPNYYGLLEDATAFFEALHNQQGVAIAYVNPLSLGILKSPAEMNADIAIGDAQPLGLALNFGGPYLGFIATKKEYMRKLPGRIVGASLDSEGHRAFVLTLQAREQHIRREKATSNICSNQSLMALCATIYLSLLGSSGLQKVATANLDNSHYCYEQLLKLPKFKAVYDAEFFNEFVVSTTLPLDKIDQALWQHGYSSGIHLNEHQLMVAVTEKRSKAEIDGLVKILGGL